MKKKTPYRLERFTDVDGAPRFHLIDPKGEIMFTSQAYFSSSNRNRGVRDVLEVFGCAEGSDGLIIHLGKGPKPLIVSIREESI
jgi:uncharacterized protein YegP (UPF0339 family)